MAKHMIGWKLPDPPVSTGPLIDLNGVGAGIDESATFIDGDATMALCVNATADEIDNNPIVSMTMVGSGFTADDEIIKLGTSGVEFPIGSNSTTTVTAGSTTFAVAYTTSNKTWAVTKNGGGSAAASEWQAFLRAIKYVNDTTPATTGDRTLTITADDGVATSTPAVLTISVQSALTGTAVAITTTAFDWTQSDGDVYVASDAVVSSNTGVITQLTMTLTGFVDNDYEVVSIADRIFMSNETRTSYGWIHGVRYDLSYNGTTKVLTATPAVSALSTETVCQELIRSVRYWRMGKGLTVGDREFEFVINDGSTTSTPVTVTMTQRVALTIRVVSNTGAAISGATVTLKDALNNTIATGSSDAGGVFTATIDENGSGYVLTVTKAGKQNYSTTRTITGDQTITCPMFTSAVTIDAAWLADTANLCDVTQTTGPYKLTAADTLYTMTADLTANHLAVSVRAACGLNLNGHTITYGNEAPVGVTNEGFETGDFTGWDTTNAPSASVVANHDTGSTSPYLYGSYAVQFTNVNGTQYITSSPTSIPVANRPYMASIHQQGASTGRSVTIDVIDDVTETVIATHTTSSAGQAAYVLFTPTTTNDVKLRCTVTTTSTQTLWIDDVKLRHAETLGIVPTPSPYSLTAWTRALTGTTGTNNFSLYCSNGTGSVVQGQNNAAYSQAVYAKTMTNMLLVDNVTLETSGDASVTIFGQYVTGTAYITNNTLQQQGYQQRLFNRQAISALVSFNGAGGPSLNYYIQNNVFVDAAHQCVSLADHTLGTHVVTNNLTTTKTKYTNAYAFSLYGWETATQLKYNTVANASGYSGRGISCDSVGGATISCDIAFNHLSVRERPNAEYSYNGLEATALRIREYGYSHSGTSWRGNYCFAYTDSTLVDTALGVRSTMSADNVTSDCNITDNIFASEVATTDSAYDARGLEIATSQNLDNVLWARNRIQSNDIALAFGGQDGGSISDMPLTTSEVRLVDTGVARSERSIRLNGQPTSGTMQGIVLTDCAATNGATLTDIAWDGSGLKNLTVKYSLDVVVTGGNNALIEIEDQTTASVYSGNTNALGLLIGAITLPHRKYEQLTTSSSVITTTSYDYHTATISQAGQTNSTATLTPDQPRYITVAFANTYEPPSLDAVAPVTVEWLQSGVSITITNSGGAASGTFLASGTLPDDLSYSNLQITGNVAGDATLGLYSPTIAAVNAFGRSDVTVSITVDSGVTAPSVVNSTIATGASVSSVSCNVPSGGGSGDIIYALVSSGTRDVSTPSGWTSLHSVDNATDSSFKHKVFYRVHSGSEPASYTFSFVTAIGNMAIVMVIVADGKSPATESPVIASSSYSYANPITIPTITPTAPNSLVIRMGGTSNGALCTTMTDNGHTAIRQGTATLSINTMYRVENDVASGVLTFTTTGAGNRLGLAMAIEPV